MCGGRGERSGGVQPPPTNSNQPCSTYSNRPPPPHSSSHPQGVLIKGSRYLELLGRLKVISLDKTGTLTQGAFEIKALRTFPGFDERQVLRWAAALERQSTHPVAAAIVGYAAARGASLSASSGGGGGSGGGPAVAREVTEVAGKGVSGVVDGVEVSVLSWLSAYEHVVMAASAASAAKYASDDGGGAAAAAERGSSGGGGSPTKHAAAAAAAAANAAACSPSGRGGGSGIRAQHSDGGAAAADLAAAQQAVDEWSARGASAVGVVAAGRLAALLVVADGLRPDAPAAVEALRALGIRLSIMTGDGMGAAVAAAEQLGIDVADTYAELLPRDKLEMLSVLRRREGALAHVGDGVNDAPALAAADVGVAMGAAGAAAAVEAADVALFGSDLSALAFAVRLGRRAGWIVTSNIAFAVAVKVAVLAAAAGGATSLWLSLLADVGASLAVTLHALSLLRFEAGGGGGFDQVAGKGAGGAAAAGGWGARLRRLLPWGDGQRYSEIAALGAEAEEDDEERCFARTANSHTHAGAERHAASGVHAHIHAHAHGHAARHRHGGGGAVELGGLPRAAGGKGCCEAAAAAGAPCAEGGCGGAAGGGGGAAQQQQAARKGPSPLFVLDDD